MLEDVSPDFFFWMAGFFVLGSPSTLSGEGYERMGLGQQKQMASWRKVKGLCITVHSAHQLSFFCKLLFGQK